MAVGTRVTPPRRARVQDQDPDLVRAYLDEIGSTPLLTAAQEVELARRIEAGVYAAELLRRGDAARAAGQGGLDPERRRELAVLAEDGEQARNHMVRANLRLVVSIAKKHIREGVSLLDVIQDGNIGLMHAVEKFDYAKGFKFSTYATWWIRQAIDRGMADHSRTIRLPVHVAGELARFARVERKLALRLQRDPTVEELAAEVGTPVTRLVELRKAAREAVSLDTPVGGDEDTRLGDLIEDTDGVSADDIVEQNALVDELRALVSTLPPREATIISMRFGLLDGREHTLQQIADHLGCTRERVRQLEKQALAELRDPARRQRLSEWAA